MVDDLHPLEESVEVFGDDVLERNEAGGDIAADGAVRGRGDIEEPGQARGHLDPGEEYLAGVRVAQEDAEVERESRDVGERVGRVHSEWGEDREDMAGEEFVDPGTFVLGQLVHLDLRDRLRVEAGPDVVLEQGGMAGHEFVGPDADRVHHLQRHPPGDAGHGQAGVDAAFEAGDAHHEEFVEVGGEDREEADPLQQRHVRV